MACNELVKYLRITSTHSAYGLESSYFILGMSKWSEETRNKLLPEHNQKMYLHEEQDKKEKKLSMSLLVTTLLSSYNKLC